MKNVLFLLFLAAFFAPSCKKSAPKTTAAPEISFSEMLQNYHEERLKLFPIEATFAGDARYNDLLPNNLTAAFRNEVQSFFTKNKNLLAKIDRSKLNDEEKISFDILNWECDVNLEGLKFPTYLMPINQFDCLHLQMGQWAGGTAAQPFKTVKDYENWLKRVDLFIVWCDSAMTNMKLGMAAGIVLPKSLAVKTVPQFADLATGKVENHLYFSPVKNFPVDFSTEEKAKLTADFKKMIAEKLMPTFGKMADFLKNEYLPVCRTTSGISETPLGKDYYAFRAKLFTTTTTPPDEIFNLGEKEVARIFSEMEKVKMEVGFRGGLKSFFDHVRERKELMPFKKPEEVIANFNAIHERMKPNLVKLFDKTPKTPFEVRRTEAFREASASAEYMQGSVDGTRPGIFYTPIPDVRQYNMYSDEDLFLHEAIPGHHYQISLQQENTALPAFRRTLWYSAYGEGWALYTESLGKELGLYTDPYQYFGMLSAEMHRAIRLVVDVGLHQKGWSREQAIQYSLDHEAESEASIISEIERYMANPGQALSYKIGQLKIRELREKSAVAMGEKFDIRQFHNQVLESGCVPLKVLEEKILGRR